MSRHSHRPAADNFDVAGLGPTSRSRANQRMGQRQGPGRPPTMQARPDHPICITRTGENSEQGQVHRRLLMEIREIRERLNSLEVPGAEDVPLNKLSKQDHGKGERSEQRDQTELSIPTSNNTSRRAQASPSYHRLRRGEKDISSDEDNAEMCTGRIFAPPTHEHGRNESSMSLPPQNPSSVQTRGKNWTNPEDILLIQAHGAPNGTKKKSWTDIALNIPGRTGKQCRLRWDTLLRNYRNVHRNQGRSKEEYFQDLLSGRISCGQGESSQRDHLQERAGESWKKRKTVESDVAQDCHCKRERLFEVHETNSILQLAQRFLKIQERNLELKELKYERKTSGAEPATSQDDGLRAAEVGAAHWSSGQTNFVVPLHQEPVGQLCGGFPFVGCEGVPQLNFNGI